ncbi:MAG TPA: M23 family metallopeptidase, partial [Candidatus Saccharimonadales bacterium]|nr:M23 family metallopeptidase [Candidatus Saccharimonadales bacterium]
DVVGRAEFAITDGTIESLHIYDGISGCYSFHIKSSTDGYDYYYTHARNPAVRDGQQVKVGDKVAEVGERKCTGNGSYPHLHIDRGKPKGAIGGYECCRDSGLVPIINKLYASLPG